MRLLERILGTILQTFRLDSVKQRILALAVLATLIPTGTTGWLLYSQNKTALTGKIHEELRSASISVAREFDLWLKERIYELRVFSGSYELSENVEKALRGGASRAQVIRRAQDYLKSVQGKFSDYEDLFVLDTTGAVIVANAKHVPSVPLPSDADPTSLRGRSALRPAGSPARPPVARHRCRTDVPNRASPPARCRG